MEITQLKNAVIETKKIKSLDGILVEWRKNRG